MVDPVSFAARFLDRHGVEHTCRVRCASLDDILILTETAALPGDTIVCRAEGLGTLNGNACEGLADGFRFGLSVGALQRERLAGRLRWHLERASGRADLRQGARVVPDRPSVVVSWPGCTVPGTLRDVSAGGAAVDLAPSPPVGTPVTLGRRRGTVIRHTEAGIGVRFVMPLRPEDVRASIVL